jgi:hypothetical protein
MKKLALIITLFAAIGTNVFAQGYTLFDTAKQNVYDEFTDPGVGVVAPGDVTATFLWTSMGTSDPLGVGVATTGVSSTAGGWSTVSAMLSSGWSIGENYNSGFTPTEADVADNASGIAKGALSYNGGTTFQLANTLAGSTYEFVVIGWDNLGGDSTLEQAMADNVALGWSGSFDYTTGVCTGMTVSDFSESGETAFGVAGPAPEPATLALAGLGGLSMLLIRRRKS